MRKITLLGLLVGLVALAVPALASANSVNSGTNCDYASQSGNKVAVGTGAVGAGDVGSSTQVDVYSGPGSTGNAGTSATGACANVNGFGGFVEEGSGTPGSYVVVDGSNNNPAQGAGYMGLSNYDDSTTNKYSCSQKSGDPASTNGGGCFGLKPTGTTVDFNALGLGAVPTPMCGDTSGPNWNQTPRDGCFIP
jgi:hypothetical protein